MDGCSVPASIRSRKRRSTPAARGEARPASRPRPRGSRTMSPASVRVALRRGARRRLPRTAGWAWRGCEALCPYARLIRGSPARLGAAPVVGDCQSRVRRAAALRHDWWSAGRPRPGPHAGPVLGPAVQVRPCEPRSDDWQSQAGAPRGTWRGPSEDAAGARREPASCAPQRRPEARRRRQRRPPLRTGTLRFGGCVPRACAATLRTPVTGRADGARSLGLLPGSQSQPRRRRRDGGWTPRQRAPARPRAPGRIPPRPYSLAPGRP